MKYILIVFAVTFCIIKVSGQDAKAPNYGSFLGLPKGLDQTQITNWRAQSADAGSLWSADNGIKGNAFYAQDWSNGYILLQDKRVAKDISMNFNLYTNEIYYVFDSTVLVVDPKIKVFEFGIDDTKNLSGNPEVFRCGYPGVDNNSVKTFYNIIADGKLTLLRHFDKTIMYGTDPLGAPEKRFIDSESWYVYNSAENKMVLIKKNKNALIAAFPQYADKINSIVDEKKLKLKKEDEWVILFTELSKTI